MDRAIIHLNIADFAVAVETNIQPALKGYPVIIAPLGAPRAVVYDMSEQAFQQGIRKGMPLARAKRLNKKIHILPPCFNRYEMIMKDLLKESFIFTPKIESGRLDGHIFMDVTGSSRLFGPPVDMAFKLKKAFKKTFNLDPIWSVATNKLVAKVATRIVKPTGEYIVAPGDEQAFLAPLPLHLIPGLEQTDLTLLYEFNLFEVIQARALTLKQLQIPFDRRASMIYDRIRGIDPEPVNTFCEIDSSLQADHEFANDTNQVILLKKALYLLIENICKTLRNLNLQTDMAKIILSYSDGLQNNCRQKLALPTSCDMTLFKQCKGLLYKAWNRRVRIRHMRLICEKRPAQNIQTVLFTKKTKETRQINLVTTMDKIREKFGKNAVKTGLTMAQEHGSRIGST
ncbi:MAG: hypothetical protein ABIJ59_09785 [Pseudomonadota bacterium]